MREDPTTLSRWSVFILPLIPKGSIWKAFQKAYHRGEGMSEDLHLESYIRGIGTGIIVGGILIFTLILYFW